MPILTATLAAKNRWSKNSPAAVHFNKGKKKKNLSREKDCSSKEEMKRWHPAEELISQPR